MSRYTLSQTIWMLLAVTLVAVVAYHAIPKHLYSQPQIWLQQLPEWSVAQLDRIRSPQHITQLFSFGGQLALVWLTSLLLLPFATFAIMPGRLQQLRISLILIVLFTPQQLIYNSLLWLDSPLYGYLFAPVLQTTSIGAIWLLITNRDEKEKRLFANPAGISSQLRAYLLIQLPTMWAAIPLHLAIALLLLSRQEAYNLIADLLVLLSLLLCMRFSNYLSRTSINTAGNPGGRVWAGLIRCLVALLWAAPVFCGLVWILATGQTFITTENLWRLLLLLPAAIVGIPLGLTSTPSAYAMYPVVAVAATLAAGTIDSANLVYQEIVNLFRPATTTLMVWIIQIAGIAGIAGIGWRSFSYNKRHAISLVQTENIKLWLWLLRKPLLNTCCCALLFAAWISVQSILATFLLSLILAPLFALFLIHSSSLYDKRF